MEALEEALVFRFHRCLLKTALMVVLLVICLPISTQGQSEMKGGDAFDCGEEVTKMCDERADWESQDEWNKYCTKTEHMTSVPKGAVFKQFCEPEESIFQTAPETVNRTHRWYVCIYECVHFFSGVTELWSADQMQAFCKLKCDTH
jgi:hypothetical protein